MSKEVAVENVAWRDALDRSGLFTGTAMVDADDTTHPKMGTMDYNEDKRVVQYVGHFADQHWEDKNARIVYSTGDSYQGSVRASRKEGYGVLTWGDGRSYAGAFVKDQRHGQGTYRWPDGSYYTGQFTHNQREGFGTYTAGAVSYVGNFSKGFYHGQGTYQYSDKRTGEAVVYTGEFASGVPNGVGKETTRGGTIVRHEGLWKDGQPVRQQLRKRDSLEVVVDQPWFDPVSHFPAVYRGLWNERRQPEGNGTASYSKGPIREYEGCWKNGQYHGEGRIMYRNGDLYTGSMQESKREGAGTFQWKDGRQYAGDWKDNVRTGNGVFTWPTGDRYEGEFQNGQRSGSGRFVFGDSGAYYSGEWKRGMYNGRGKMVDSSGACYDGEFFDGQRHGAGEEHDSTGKLHISGQWANGEFQTDDMLKAKSSFTEPTTIDDTNQEPSITEEDEPEECEVSRDTTEISDEVSESKIDEPQPEEIVEPPPESSGSDENQSTFRSPPSSPPPPVPAQTLLRGWSHRNEEVSTRRSIPGEEKECVAVVDKWVTDGLGCPGLYTGLVLKGRPHGVGRLVYEDGKRIHEGFWTHGSKEGHGRCLFSPQQDFHDGEYKGNLRHGPGRYSWADGRQYVGDYMHDKRHGHGVFTYPNGERYEGSFIDGHRSGFGRFEFIESLSLDGKRVMGYYEGEWKEGEHDGNGRMSLSLWAYDGEWANGSMHGRGTKTDAAGTVMEHGEWANGELVHAENMPSDTPEPSESQAIVVD